jgi:hypothetical protein
MTSPTVDQRYGLVGSIAFKSPCRVASTGALTLSGAQAINGVSVVAGDRVLVKNQSTASSNGIYDADTGAWTRAKDFDGNNDVRTGTLVYVTGGTSVGKGIWTVSSTGSVIGTDSISFAAVLLTT